MPQPRTGQDPIDAQTAMIPKPIRKSIPWLRNIHHTSFYSQAPELYNTLPDHLRNELRRS